MTSSDPGVSQQSLDHCPWPGTASDPYWGRVSPMRLASRSFNTPGSYEPPGLRTITLNRLAELMKEIIAQPGRPPLHRCWLAPGAPRPGLVGDALVGVGEPGALLGQRVVRPAAASANTAGLGARRPARSTQPAASPAARELLRRGCRTQAPSSLILLARSSTSFRAGSSAASTPRRASAAACHPLGDLCDDRAVEQVELGFELTSSSLWGRRCCTGTNS